MVSREALPNSGVPYKFGFNGKLNDNEVKGGYGLQQDYGMRIYDNRVGRFLSVDPITKQYPELTPYQFASNRPIDGVDQDGEEYLKNIPKFEYSSNRTWQDYVSAIDNAGIDIVNLVSTTWNSLVVTAQGLYEHKYLQNLKNDAKQLASGVKQIATKFVNAPLTTLSSPQSVEFFTNAFIGAKVFSPVKNNGGLMKPVISESVAAETQAAANSGKAVNVKKPSGYGNWGSETLDDAIRTIEQPLKSSTPIAKNSVIEGYKVSNHAWRKSGLGRGGTEELVSNVITNARKAGTVATEKGTGQFANNVINVYTHDGIKVAIDETRKLILSTRPEKGFKLP
jgi:RHS repeat-associated protein